ncbi:cadherin-like domain-containing protein, partial [Accumulibacter sp.]|uniref:cadherin-like domain-containing protein n=1 Tax=Accumulibacter sp. TaxID=2053492 RepID=UPI0035B3D877
TDGHGTPESVTTPATAAVTNVNDAPTGAVGIDNATPAQGDTLTASNTLADPDGMGTVTYTWKANGTTIGTGTTYVLTEAEVGKLITVVASYTDGHGTAEAVTSAATAAVTNVNDAPTGAVSIDNATPAQGDTLTASNTLADPDGMGTITYTWKANGTTIGAGTTYTLTEAEVGKLITVVASYTDGHGTAESVASVATALVRSGNYSPIGLPVITGEAIEDALLTVDTSAVTDADGLGAFAYQWLRDGFAVPGAIHSTYTPGDADVGTRLSVEVTFTDGHGTRESLISATLGPVANVNDAPTMVAASIHLRIAEAVVLSTTNIAATDVDSPIDSLVYSVTDVLGGRFEQVSRPGLAISSFTYGDLDAGGVRFVHDGSPVAPFFRVSASDGLSSSATVVAQVSFDVRTNAGEPLQNDENADRSADNRSRSTVDAASSTPATLPTELPAAVAVGATVGGPPVVAAQELIEQQLLVSPVIQPPVLQPTSENSVVPPDASRRTAESEGFAGIPLDDYLFRLVSMTLAQAAHGSSGGELSAGEIGADAVSGSETVTRELSIQTVQMLGISLTAGAVWWAVRVSGLLTSLLASLPAWRQLDLLLILPDDEQADRGWGPDDDQEAARDEEAVGNILVSSGSKVFQ